MIVDEKSALYLAGTTLDFVDTLQESGFKIAEPERQDDLRLRRVLQRVALRGARDDSDPIYLDHHATTPVDPRVVEAMAPYWREEFGNARARRMPAAGARRPRSSTRASGSPPRSAPREPREIVFTSGATESDNLALRRAARGARARATTS